MKENNLPFKKRKFYRINTNSCVNKKDETENINTNIKTQINNKINKNNHKQKLSKNKINTPENVRGIDNIHVIGVCNGISKLIKVITEINKAKEDGTLSTKTVYLLKEYYCLNYKVVKK